MELSKHCLVLFALLCVLGHTVVAETIFVTQTKDLIASGDGCSLREAISSANGSPLNGDCETGETGHDLIVLPPEVLYVTLGVDAGGEDVNLSGDFDILDDLTIEGEISSVVDGLGQTEIFEIFNATVRFREMEIRQGYTSNGGRAGGITNYAGGILYLERVVMRDNFAEDSGPGYLAGAILSEDIVFVTESTFEGNTAVSTGVDDNLISAGGILASTSVVIQDSSFSRNIGRSGLDSRNFVSNLFDLDTPLTAGAVAMVTVDPSAMIQVSDSTFDRNDGVNGGALLSIVDGSGTASVQARGCSFTNNDATASGGAIFANGHVLIQGTGSEKLERNSAIQSGGVVMSLNAIDVEQVGIIADNNAAFGGAFVSGGNLRVRNVNGDIRDNSAPYYVGAPQYSGYAGFAYSASSIEVSDVTGSISGHIASYGGVAFAPDVDIRRIGGNIYRNTADIGAVVYSVRSNIEDVSGSLNNNNAAEYGSIVAASESIRVFNTGTIRDNEGTPFYAPLDSDSFANLHTVAGIYRNSGRYGGVAAATFVRVENILGNIADNESEREGGVVNAFLRGSIAHVTGSITGNSAAGRGGVLNVHGSGAEPALLSDIFGSVADNTAGVEMNYSAGGGGVVFGTNGVIIRNIGGDIRNNRQLGSFEYIGYITDIYFPSSGGGVANCGGYYATRCVISGVGGSVYGNYARHGGVILANSAATLSNVGGNVSRNNAEGSGGVILSRTVGVIDGVTGDIYHNTAGFGTDYLYSDMYGGVVAGVSGVIISRVTGSIDSNSVVGGEGRGGVAWSFDGDIRLFQTGSIVRNSSSLHGGVAYAGSGAVNISNVTGSIARNTAPLVGGVAVADSIEVQNVAGSIYQNVACSGAGYSVGGAFSSLAGLNVINVAGDIRGNKCVAGVGVINVGLAYGVDVGSGGFAFSLYGPVFIAEVGGSIYENTANTGAVVASTLGAISIVDVGGSIRDNRAEIGGGVAFAGFSDLDLPGTVVAYQYYGEVRISGVGGSIRNNSCSGYTSGGGVLSNNHGPAFIENVHGDIADNYCHRGGVLRTTQLGTIADVYGSIVNNSAAYGGVIASQTGARVENVTGSITKNSSQFLGGIVYSFGDRSFDVVIAQVGGDISYNYACLDERPLTRDVNVDYDYYASGGGGIYAAYPYYAGGFFGGFFGGGYVRSVDGEEGQEQPRSVESTEAVEVNSFGSVRVHDVAGSIRGNGAAHDSCHGGFVSSTGSVKISNIGGHIEKQFSGGRGGVAYATSGLEISNVAGSIRYNTAVGGGGVGVAVSEIVRIENVGGDISHNRASYNTSTRDVDGAIEAANEPCGGVICGQRAALISNVGGSIEYNAAGVGGVLASNGISSITNVLGNIRYNTGIYTSGVIFGRDSASLVNVGAVTHNTSDYYGVGYSTTVTLSGIYGDLSYNVSTFGHGGAVMAFESLSVNEVAGSIAYNDAYGNGGFGYSEGNAWVSNVSGSIAYNTAGTFGGFLAAQNAFVRFVGGDVSNNDAIAGGVLYTLYTGVLANVGGSVFSNTASENGGVLYVPDGGSIRHVGGSIYDNVAYSGGVLYAAPTGNYSGSSLIEDVAGDIRGNRALLYGGVFSAIFNQNVDYLGVIAGVYVNRIGGNISRNSADYGGVGFGARNAIIVNGAGNFTQNTANYGGVFFVYEAFLDVESVGSITDNSANYNGGFAAVANYAKLNRLTVSVSQVNGSISRNTAGQDGGVVSSVHFSNNTVLAYQSSVELSFVTGDISYNTASSGFGGVVYADSNVSTAVFLRHIDGAVHHNVCGFQGGVVRSSFVRVQNIGSGIEYNTANEGGAFYGDYAVLINHVGGSIRYNRATGGVGGVLATADTVSTSHERIHVALHDVYGDIAFNSATGSGGAIFSQGNTDILRIHGSINDNSTPHDGGFVRVIRGGVFVDTVSGNIENNSAGYNGGIASIGFGNSYTGVGCLMRNIYGDVVDNSAQSGYGGAIYSSADAVIVRNVTGSVIRNTCGSSGGFIYVSESEANVLQVGGNFSSNSAFGGFGGAIYASDVHVTNVTGNVSGNSAAAGGGFAFARVGEVLLRGVGGNVNNNRALSGEGGVLFGRNSVVIEDVAGSIASNRAAFGGVLMANSDYQKDVVIRRVGSDILRNSVTGNGGVMGVAGPGFADLKIEDIEGSISENHSSESGGVAYNIVGSVTVARVRGSLHENNANDNGGAIYLDDGTVRVHDIAGDITSNTALSGNGGLIYNNGLVEVSDVGGSVCGNSAYLYGGVVYGGYNGNVLLLTLGDGAIQDNVAYDGGVVYAEETIRVDADEGIIHNNVPNVAVSFRNFTIQVDASLNTQSGAPSISIVTQPGDGVENVPLAVQPEIDISGAVEGREIPISVTLLDENFVEIRELPGPFNIEFSDTQKFLDLQIPVVGNNLHLRFAFAIKGCLHDDVRELVNVTSTSFNITECEYPHPVLCPLDITVPTELHECSSFVDVPRPTVQRCSNPLLSHDFADSLLDTVASGNFPLGTTVVTYVAENSVGVADDCVLHVTVVDSEAPRLTCPDDIVVNNDAGQCGASVNVPLPSVADNCVDDFEVAISSSHPDPFFPVGVTSVTFEGTDSGGNSDTCTVTVTVIDNELPQITCPGDIIVACGSPPTFQAPVGTDNCPGETTTQTNGPVIGSLNPLPAGATTFSYSVVDSVGQRATCQWVVETQSTWYLDADGDGVGALRSEARVQCPAPGPNWVQDKNTDCDDTNPNLGLVVYPDADRDTYGNPDLEVCVRWDFFSTLKRDVEEGEATDNLIVRAGDCDDTNRLVNPGMIEVCNNGIDDNCNGEIDENCPPVVDTESIPTIPMPAVPLAPVPSADTPIIIPTPAPQPPPPAPSVVQPIIIQETNSSASAIATSFVALFISLFISYLM